MVLHNFITRENALDRDEDLPDDGGDNDSTWALFYNKNKAMRCPSCTRRGARHCVHLREYQRLTKERSDARHYRRKAPNRIRDALRDEFWARLDNPMFPVTLDAADRDYLDLVADLNAHASTMRERALAGDYIRN